MIGANGATLFQFDQDIHLSNNADLEQEEEERADQLRRNNEIASNLERFLAVEDDEHETTENNQFMEDSMYSRGNGDGGHDDVGSISNGDDNENELKKCTKTIEVMRLQLDARSHEVRHLTSLLEEVKLDKDRQMNDMQKRLDISTAERDRALLNRNQTHELLVESKAQITELEGREKSLKELIDVAHNENKSLRVELQQARTIISDLQYKIRLVETDVDQRHQICSNNSLKEMRERYSAQINLLQQQVDCLTDKVEKKVNTLIYIFHLTLN